MPDVDQLQARIVQLEDVVATLKAQAEAAAISAEQAGQAMEQRYSALAEGHGKVAAQKDKLQRENLDLREELTTARAEVHQLQTALMSRDAELEKKRMEITSLQQDKSSLDKLLQEKQAEIQELQTRLQAAVDRNVSLTEANTQLDGKLHEAQAAHSRAQLTQARVEQEKEILEKSNAWLNAELARKSDAYMAERRKSHEALLELQRKLAEAESSAEQLQGERERLLEKCTHQAKAAEEASTRLREVREEAAVREEQWEAEVALAQRMSQLYRDNSEERARKCKELEGIVQELKAHVESAAAANAEALQKAEAARQAAEQRVEEEQAAKEKLMQAAASGLPFAPQTSSAHTPSQHAFAITPSSGVHSSPSATELYIKLVEAQDQLRSERLKGKRQEILMEELCSEVEKRADLVREQQTEYERVKAAYLGVSSSLEALSGEKRDLEARLLQLEAENRRNSRERRSLEQQVQDLSHQLQTLLYEMQSAASGGQTTLQVLPSFSGGDVNDVTTQVLLEFKNIQELQQQNQRLLAVNRQLGAEVESGKAEAEAAVRAEYETAVQRLSAELEQLRSGRKDTEELLAQVVRQRNLLTSFLQDSGNDPDAARRAYAQSIGQMSLSKGVAGQGGQPPVAVSQAQVDTRMSNGDEEQQAASALIEDLQQQLSQLKEDASKTQEMMAQDLTNAKGEAASSRTDAARARAEAEFERERSNRLTESLKMQRHQIESLMTSAAKQQALVTDMERKLGELQASADEAKDKARQESMRAQGLEAELRVVSAAERRASNEASSLSSDKFRLAAELEAARGAHAEREGELVKELSRLREELGRTRKELSEGEKELAAARSRAEVAVNAADVAQSSSQQALQKLEEEVRQLRESLSSAQQRATAGEAKLELLQEAVRKAEERAARLEMEKNSRAQTSAGGLSEGSSTAEAELAAEVKLLREELNAAQEVAAAATGHARQYEMLARTSDEALNSMQADHEKFKADANARYASVSEEIEKLRGELHAKEEEMREAKQAEKEFAAECERLDHEHHQERKQLKAEASAARAECQAKAVQAARLREEVDVLQKQYEDAKRSYDNEVVQHGDALKRYAALDVAHTALQQRLSDAVQQLDKARTTKAQAEAEFEVQRCELQQKMVEAERRLKQLIEHRDVLQRQLEKAAEEATGEGGDYADALRLLRQEREAVEIRLQLTERENTRLRQEAAVARQSAEEARVQLSTEAERARSAVRAEQDQAVLMQKVEQFNLIRESNAALRAENSKLSIQLREATKKLRAAEAELLPLQQRISGLKADNESAAQELASVKEQQERWQQRAIQLSQRYDAVDKQEYQRVTEELKLSHQALQEREDALKTIQNKMVGLEEQLAHERGRSAELQGKLEQVGKENVLAKESLQQLQRDLDAAKDEIEKYRKRANSIWTIVVQTCNKEKLPMAEWRVAQAAKEHRLVELEERIKILQGQQEGSASAAAAEMTTLQVKISQLQSDLATAQHEAEKAKASLSEVKRRTIETAKKAAASKQQAEAEAAKFKAALNGKEARCREMSEQLDALKKEKTELAFRAKALQEDLEKIRRATYSKDVSDRMGAHNTGSAEAKRELEDIRDKAQAQQRNKLEAKRKLESYESTHENAQLAESPDGGNLRKEDQNVGDDRQDEAPMSKRNKLTTEPTTREYGDLTTQGDVVSLTDINDEADQHEIGGELEQGFGQEAMELMESGEAGEDEVPEDTLRQDRKGKELVALKLEHAQDDNEEEEAMVRSGTTVKDEVEEEDIQDAGTYEGQDVGIEEVIEYGQEEIGNEGGTEQHVDTRELNMEGSDCKDQKAEDKSSHLKEVVVKDLSLQCFEDEQQDNADVYDQETTFEEEVGDGIEHERHTSTDVQDEHEIKERQRQETQDQQEDDTFDSEEEGFREGEAHSDENDEEDNTLLDNQEVLASHDGHLPPNPENIFTERQLEHPSFESPSSVGVGRQGNPDKSPGEEPLGDQAEATKPRKRAIQWQPQPDASMKQGRGRGGRSSQIKSKVGPGRGRGTGS